jgi:hypothetical protein
LIRGNVTILIKPHKIIDLILCDEEKYNGIVAKRKAKSIRRINETKSERSISLLKKQYKSSTKI